MDEGNHPPNRKDPMSDQSTHDDLTSSPDAHSLCPTSVNDSDGCTANPRPLIKYTEGTHFDLQRITGLLTSLDPNQQCTALQLLNHAAEWESTNFTECVSVTFGPVVELLLDSKNLQVHCAALDTLKLFLASPDTVDIVKPMMPFLLYTVLKDLDSPQQSASIELINAATQSEEILVEFAPAISRISTLLPSMPAATQVTALRVLEVSAGSNMCELVKAVTNTFLFLIHPLLSPETTVQTAALKVLEASVGTKTREVSLAAVILLRILVETLPSGETDAQSAARKVLEEVDFESSIPLAAIQRLGSVPSSSGGFADIWKCSMSTPSGTRIVAVKSNWLPDVKKSNLYKIGRRVHREAYVWMQLSHDHILPFEGITNGFGSLPALISLWMENGSLSDYLKREFPQLTDPRKLELIQQVAAGVSYLHGKDIVHGDLNGTHILVDGSGNLRIAGFGSSMLLAEAKNDMFSSLTPGNTRWMAPEFFAVPSEDDEEPQQFKPTKAGDIYSFGCVMLQILSGKEPYAWIKSPQQVINVIMLGWNPFRGPINTIETHRDLSSQCLSRELEVRPSIIEITDIIGPMDSDQSFLDGDATGQRLEDSDPIPEGFFGDDSRHDPSHLPPSTPHLAFIGRFSSLFRKTNRDVRDMQTRPSRMDLARKLFSGTPVDRNGEGIELPERRPTVVEVPCAQGSYRNYSKRELLFRRKKEEERKAKIAAAGTSLRPHNNATQQSGGVTHPLSSQPHVAVSTSSATPAVTTTSAGATSMIPLPDTTMRQAGCWTRFWFWFYLCCTCADSTNDRH